MSHNEAESIAYHFPIADRSVVSLKSTTSFLVLHPLLHSVLCPGTPQVYPMQDARGPPSTTS